MSIDEKKAVVRGYLEQVWNGKRPDLVPQFMAEEAVHHDAPGLDDRESIQNFITGMVAAFPDLKIRIVQEIADGDIVAVRQTITGTQKGEMLGIPATGKQFTIVGVYMFRVINGKIAELWGIADNMSMMQQLGVVPVPEAGHS